LDNNTLEIKMHDIEKLIEFHKMFHASTTLEEARNRARREGWALRLEWDGLVGMYLVTDPARPNEQLGTVSLRDGYGEPEAKDQY
jgi:hypothetical protein